MSWYVGAFVSTIIMCALSFEELLRSYYRKAKGTGGDLRNGLKVDAASFKSLIDQAEEDEILKPKEILAINRIRTEYRNPFVHTKDYSVGDITSFNGHTFLQQQLSITAPGLSRYSAEEMARDSIRTLVTQLPMISQRLLP